MHNSWCRIRTQRWPQSQAQLEKSELELGDVSPVLCSCCRMQQPLERVVPQVDSGDAPAMRLGTTFRRMSCASLGSPRRPTSRGRCPAHSHHFAGCSRPGTVAKSGLGRAQKVQDLTAQACRRVCISSQFISRACAYQRAPGKYGTAPPSDLPNAMRNVQETTIKRATRD